MRISLNYKTYFADFLLLMVAFTWGFTFVIVKNVVEILPPHSFNGVRFFIAALFLLVVILIKDRSILTTMTWKKFLIGSLLGFFLFSGYAFQTIGLMSTTVSKAGFITGMSVVIVPILAVIMLRDAVRRQAVIGISVAVLGLFLLSFADGWHIESGDLLVFCGAICFAIHIVLIGKWSPAYNALGLAFIQILAVGVFSSSTALVTGELMTFSWTIFFQPTVYWSLIICAIFATALAFLIQTAAQKFTSPTKTAIIFATEPVFAAMAGYLFAHDILSSKELVGCALILLGMLVAEWPSRTERATDQLAKIGK